MAGGQERILRRRIKIGPVDEEDHEGDGAHRRLAHRQGPGAGRRGPALQRADHRGDPQPRRRRRRARPPAAASPATRSAGVAFVVITADRGLAGGYNSSVIRAAERAMAADRAAGRDVHAASSSARRPTATSASAATTSSRAFPGDHRPAHLRGRPRDRRRRQRGVRGRRGRPGRARLHPVPLGRHRSGSCSAASCRSRRRRSSDGGVERRPERRLRVRAGARRHPRPAAAPLRRGPAVRGPARRVGVRARRPPAGHEVGHRQRRGADHHA